MAGAASHPVSLFKAYAWAALASAAVGAMVFGYLSGFIKGVADALAIALASTVYGLIVTGPMTMLGGYVAQRYVIRHGGVPVLAVTAGGASVGGAAVLLLYLAGSLFSHQGLSLHYMSKAIASGAIPGAVAGVVFAVGLSRWLKAREPG